MAVRANALSGRDWLRNSFSIWRDLPRDGDRKSHPASFPVSLIRKVLSCYARGPESLVLDPFAGSGSTLLAATHAGMRSIGLDINERYKDLFLNRLDLFDFSQNGSRKNIWRYEICDARERSAFLGVVPEKSVDVCYFTPLLGYSKQAAVQRRKKARCLFGSEF